MSAVVFGLALGLNAASPVITADMNPHMLVADRHYQELVYRDRPVFRVAENEVRQRITLKRKARAEGHAASEATASIR